MKYQKKPVAIEAVPVSDIVGRTWDHGGLPKWVVDGIRAGQIVVHDSLIVVRTIEGNMTGKSDDMLIQGVRGELYPCNGEIFAESYQEVV